MLACAFLFYVLRIMFASSFWQTDLDHFSHHPHRIGGDIYHRRQGSGLAGADIKPGAMARADDLVLLDLPVPHRTIIVRTHIPDRI